MIESPCVKVCTLDAGRAVCIGCCRTVAEIGRWASMDAAERASIMAELPGRQSNVGKTLAAATE
jgi:hypothetical protein